MGHIGLNSGWKFRQFLWLKILNQEFEISMIFISQCECEIYSKNKFCNSLKIYLRLDVNSHYHKIQLRNKIDKIMFLMYNINMIHLFNSLNNQSNLDLSMLNMQDHMININNHQHNILLCSQMYKIMLLMYNINMFHLFNSLYNCFNLDLSMSNIRNHILK